MSDPLLYRYTVDSTDDAGCAVIERDDGLSFPVPVHWLPEGVEPGQLLSAKLESSNTKLTIHLEITSND